MPFSRYKIYTFKDDKDYNGNGSTNEYISLGSILDENDYYTSSETIENFVSQDKIEKALRSPIQTRYKRFFLLHNDETIKEEITDMVLDSGSIEKSSETGQSRSVNITLINEKRNVLVGIDKQGKGVYEERYLWTPTPYQNQLWYYNKIKIYSGIIVGDFRYEVDEGIFVMFDPSLKSEEAGETVSLQLYDKYALIDGTLDGMDDIDYEVPLNTPIENAIRSLIRLPKNKRGEPFDFKDIIFPLSHKDAKTAYTIKKTSENSIGELITEMTKSISCDSKYNTDGQLVVSDSLADLDYHNRKVAWKFQEGEFKEPSAKIARSKIKNKVTVKGSNINGMLSKSTVENTNPLSNYNVNSEFGIKGVVIEDNLISGDFLCRERARYELKKYAQNYVTVDFQCIYIPHIEPGDIVIWNYPKWGIENQEFLVNTVSVPLNSTEYMSISITNLNELPL